MHPNPWFYKSDRTGRSNRFNREPASNPVRLWQKIGNILKTGSTVKTGRFNLKTGKTGSWTGSDRLGDFYFYFYFTLRRFVLKWKSNPKPKLKSLSVTLQHGFKNRTGPVGPTGSTGNRPLIQSGYDKNRKYIKNQKYSKNQPVQPKNRKNRKLNRFWPVGGFLFFFTSHYVVLS